MGRAPTELVAAAVVCARSGRSRLGNAIQALQEYDDTEDISARLSEAIGELYGVETGGEDVVVASLKKSMALLEQAMMEIVEHPTFERSRVRGVRGAIARTLATVYPALQMLERAIARSDPSIVIPLARPRMRATKNVLELVPEQDERRTAARADVTADIGFHTETNFYTGVSGDLSDGGLFLATTDVLPVGSTLTVSFMLPGGEHVTADGEVRWVRTRDSDPDLSPGMGISFRDLSPQQTAAILAFLDRRAAIARGGA